MEKVYVVLNNNFNGDDEFMGVYSSREKAQKKIAKFSKVDQITMRIEEEYLDDD